MKHSNFSVKATQLTLIQPNLIQIQSSSGNNSTQHLPKLSFKATTQPAAFMQLCNRSSALGCAFVVPWWIFWRLEIFWCTSAPSGNVSSGVILHKSSFLTPLTGLLPKPAVEAGKYTSWLGILKRAWWVEKRPWWGWGSLDGGWCVAEDDGVSLKSHWRLGGVREERIAQNNRDLRYQC